MYLEYSYMTSFKSICQWKHHYWGLGISLEQYYQEEFERVWKPEHNRFYLNLITEKGKNSELQDLVDLNYIDQDPLPKRFSFKQDKYGFYNDNTQSTLLDRIPYSFNLEEYQTFPFDDISTIEEEQLGHDFGNNWNKAQAGLLKNINYHTGASKRFTYEDNEYGVRLKSIDVNPAGSPSYKEVYTYRAC